MKLDLPYFCNGRFQTKDCWPLGYCQEFNGILGIKLSGKITLVILIKCHKQTLVQNFLNFKIRLPFISFAALKFSMLKNQFKIRCY